MTQTRIADAIESFEEVLESEGVHGALRFLNARAPHRFTGVYRFEPPVLRNVRLFDRENPMLEIGEDVAVRESYCSITGAGAAPFSTDDSLSDERLADHPARLSTRSYCGVPLLDSSGAVVGTLCHFDVTPRATPNPEIALMQAATPALMRVLREQGLIASER